MSLKRVIGSLFLAVASIFPCVVACQSSPSAPVVASGAACKDEPFTYDQSGQNKWCGECNNPDAKTQAPINIIRRKAKPNGSLPVLGFSGYKSAKLVTVKNEHNLKVSYKDEQSFLNIDGKPKPFKLDEFHFHRPGEEKIDGEPPAMVIHLVHNSVQPVVPGGAIAIAIMVEPGQPEPNTEALVNKLIQYFPPPDGRQGGSPGVDINVADLLPKGSFRRNHSYYTYTGSLTTPGCDGPLTFYVLKTPVIFSSEQIKKFEERYKLPNARNIQPTNGRPVEQTTTK
ncbi:MAG TPA: carbonic anhydrase family protein [Candidatus Angelobacter sp.]|nr:carbonic anhydrase family protein [Candidatus Angelobacter sp.]